jgi:hypothetical protein
VEQETDKASPNRKTHHELVTTLPETVPVDETRDVTFEDRGCGEAASSCITATKRKGRTKVTRWVGAEGVPDDASSGSVQLFSGLTASAPQSRERDR